MPRDNTPTARIRRMLGEAEVLMSQNALLRDTLRQHLPELAAGLPDKPAVPNILYEQSYQRILGSKVDANRRYAQNRRDTLLASIGLEPHKPEPTEQLQMVEPIVQRAEHQLDPMNRKPKEKTLLVDVTQIQAALAGTDPAQETKIAILKEVWGEEWEQHLQDEDAS